MSSENSETKPTIPKKEDNNLFSVDNKITEVHNILEDNIVNPIFEDPTYYKKILSGESTIGQKIHKTLTMFLKPETNEDKSNARNLLPSLYWQLIKSIIEKNNQDITPEKKNFLRYALLLPKSLQPNQLEIFKKTSWNNQYPNDKFYYLDEWLEAVNSGKTPPLATDEAPTSFFDTSTEQRLIKEKLNETQGKIDILRNIIVQKNQEKDNVLANIQEYIDNLKNTDYHELFKEAALAFNADQKQSIKNINLSLQKLSLQDRTLSDYNKDLNKMLTNLENFQEKLESIQVDGDNNLGIKEITQLNSLVKMMIGKRGNSIPILFGEFMPHMANAIGIRENVMKIVRELEEIDPTIFHKSYRNQMIRIMPEFILLPCYGDSGKCWQAVDFHNKATGSGRIGIPMYAPNLSLAIIKGLAHFRWEFNKEINFRWREDGLTGRYFQWFLDSGLKGSETDQFIKDYVLWITKEKNGIQGLDKEVRGIFWRNMPFSQEIKEKLAKNAMIYKKLLDNDENIKKSKSY